MQPLTHSQRLFWQGQQLDPSAPLYNMAWRFDLEMSVDPEVFSTVFADMVQANAALRATFHQKEGKPFCQIAETLPEPLSIEDWSSDPTSERLDQSICDWTQALFDLSRTTLRSRLIKCAPNHWVWLLCQHHIACDAQSGANMFTDMSRRYLAARSGQPAPAPGVAAIPPSKEHLLTHAVTRAVVPATPPYGSEGVKEARSTRRIVGLDDRDHQQLDTVAADPAFRMFTPDLSRLALYLTAYVALLHRVTGDEHVTLGLPSHNRMTPDARQAFGLFVDVLPFEVSVSPEDRLVDLHGRIKTGLGAFLKSAQNGAGPDTDSARISAICNFIQARFGLFAEHPAHVQWLHSGAHDTNHVMRLQIMDFHGTGRAQVALDLHDEIAANAATEHFRAMLRAVLNTPETCVHAVDLSDGQATTSCLAGALEPEGTPATLLSAFGKTVATMPQAAAIWQSGMNMTYRELEDASRRMAAHLFREGIKPGERVALHLPRSVDYIVAMLGVLKAGCSFVPIAMDSPFARVEQILSQSRAKAIVVGFQDARRFPAASILPKWRGVDPVQGDLPNTDATEDAYVLFTSGSTGTPKGVAVPHGAFARYIAWAARSFGPQGAKDYPFFSSISFDLTLTSLFVPLMTGGAIRVYPERGQPDLAVLDVFAEDAVDVVKLTPSHLALVSKQASRVSRIKSLVLGGENLTSHLCRQAQDRLSPNLEIINEYGPTEAVVGAMLHRFDRSRDTAPSVQIGEPAAGMEISIRDGALNPCPPGVTGEIVISGRLARGYANDAELTAEKFVKDPATGSTLYRSGDLGRVTLDGAVQYLGRRDQQIKRGGIRLESAEIEGVIKRLPGVDAVHVALVTGRKDAKAQCRHCGIPDNVPGADFREADLCGTCADFDSYKDRAQAYFKSEHDLHREITRAKSRSKGKYDAIMLLSGGKDSTYAAYRLAAHTSRVLALTLDNGFISNGAKDNIARVTAHLGWDHQYLHTDKMNEIFVDSLKTHSNVCQGCFKAVYTLAFRKALHDGVPLVVTGLSRGQFFETRLTADLFRQSAPTCAQLDDMVSQARKRYHAEPDKLAELLDTSDLQDGRFLDEIEVLDLYRYIDVPVAEIYEFLDTQTAWQRPADTGRSTNCLINDLGIHVHKTREGFHNYAHPYAWDVRLGHKTRLEAVAELDDQIDVPNVLKMLDQIGFDEALERPARLIAYIAGTDLSEDEIWRLLDEHLPAGMRPDQIALLDHLPLTDNGKIDAARLPETGQTRAPEDDVTPAQTGIEQSLVAIISACLGQGQISTTRDFFDLGVDSLMAIEIAMRANEAGLSVPAASVFEHRTVRALAQYAEQLGAIDKTAPAESDDMLLSLDDDDLSRIAEALD